MAAADDSRRQRVLATIDAIPKGNVATYGQVAEEAGLPRRARYVARVLRESPPPVPGVAPLPWHRVLGAGGWLRTEGPTRRRQTQLLRGEGVVVSTSGASGPRVDLERFGWDGE